MHQPTEHSTRTPLVTVITPTYNRAGLLPETIRSIMAQEYPHIEYLVLDDGSSDHTRQVVEALQQEYPGRIDYLHHANKGEAETVNDGWNRAQGDYVMVVNSDDPQPPALIRRSVEVMMQHPDVLVTYPDWRMIDIQGKTVKYFTLKDYGLAYMLRFAHCFIGPGALINRKALAGRIMQLRNKQYPYVSDFECWLNIGLLGSFRHIPEPLAAWRSHADAITSQHSLRMLQMVVDLLEAFFRRPDLPPDIARLCTQALVSANLRLARIECARAPATWFKRLAGVACRHPIATIRFLYVHIGICVGWYLRGPKHTFRTQNADG